MIDSHGKPRQPVSSKVLPDGCTRYASSNVDKCLCKCIGKINSQFLNGFWTMLQMIQHWVVMNTCVQFGSFLLIGRAPYIFQTNHIVCIYLDTCHCHVCKTCVCTGWQSWLPTKTTTAQMLLSRSAGNRCVCGTCSASATWWCWSVLHYSATVLLIISSAVGPGPWETEHSAQLPQRGMHYQSH